MSRYNIAFRLKNTNQFVVDDKYQNLSLSDAEKFVAVHILQCGRSYEDIKIYKSIWFATNVEIVADDSTAKVAQPLKDTEV